MKVCKNLVEFYNLNDKDLTNVLVKKFKSLLMYVPLEDLKSEIYLRLHSKNYVANFRPLEINIDEENSSWEIKPSYAKFSTYIIKFIYNYIFAYHNKINPNDTCLSLDAYDDSGFNKNDESRKRYIHKNKADESAPRTDFFLELEQYLENLKHKTKHRGCFVFDNDKEAKIIKVLDKFGDRGVEEGTFLKLVTDGVIDGRNENGLLLVLKDQVVNVTLSLEKKGAIKSDTNDGGVKRYYLDDPERRSLYKLLKYYIMGYKDKEISQKFKMSVAGIGAMKRILREEIKGIKTNNPII